MSRLPSEAPALRAFIGGYYHQDWDLVDGTVLGPVDLMMSEAPSSYLDDVRRELRALLQGNLSERTLEDFVTKSLGEVGAWQLPDGTFGGWLAEVLRRLEAAPRGR